MNLSRAWSSCLAGLLTIGFVSGCTRAPEPQFVLNAEVQQFDPPLQEQIRAILTEETGTVTHPRMLGESLDPVKAPAGQSVSKGRKRRNLEGSAIPAATLQHGSAVFLRRCAQCHGVTGDGEGPAAATLIPKPRDYRKGIFKFTSTPYSSRPHRDDLVRVLRRGIAGTSMPAFELLPKKDLEAVVDYVIALSKRGEFESAIALEAADYWSDAESESKDDPAKAFREAFVEVVDDKIDIVVKRWQTAQERVVTPLTPQPTFTAEHVERGREFFLNQTTGCFKCHGEDGRGQTPDNLRGDLKDAWGHPTQAADLTSGMLRGGAEPIDIYRRIYSGINGTPMPSFATLFAKEPERVWDVVAFVLYISNERRRGTIPDAAIGPMPGLNKPAAESQPAAATNNRPDARVRPSASLAASDGQ